MMHMCWQLWVVCFELSCSSASTEHVSLEGTPLVSKAMYFECIYTHKRAAVTQVCQDATVVTMAVCIETARFEATKVLHEQIALSLYKR